MEQPVVIKATRSGIIVILDDKLPFKELKGKIAEKFRASSKFLGNAQVVLALRGRELSADEQKQVVEIITDSCGIQVMYLMEEDEAVEEEFGRKLSACIEKMDQNTGLFYKGTIRSGQELEFEKSVIIIGDVNNGATIISRGNIVVLGSLKGSAYAGVSENTNAFVVALNMEPVQIRIGNLIARSPDKKDESREPKIAFAENGTIYIENVTRNVLSEIHLD